MRPLFADIFQPSFCIPVLLGLYALFSYCRGRSGADDMAFMVLRVYPASSGDKRHVFAVSGETVRLKDVVENIVLRMRIIWSFWRSKADILHIPEKHFRRRVMSEFRHHLSAMFNKETVGNWSLDPNGLPFGKDIIRFAFSLSDLSSAHQRKIRVVALPDRDLDWIREYGVGALLLSEELEFLRIILGDMVKHPETVAHVGKIIVPTSS